MIDKLKANNSVFNLQKQENKIIVVFVLSLLIYLFFILYGDLKKVSNLFFSFQWTLIPFLLTLTLGNYLIRAFRFYLYLKDIDINFPFLKAANIFISGLSMTATPGKSGEIVKAYLIKKEKDTKVSEIIPLLIFERLTDGLAMILLGLGGIFIITNTQIFFLFALLFSLSFVILIKMQSYVIRLITRLEKKFPTLKTLDFFITFFHNAKKLITLKNIVLGTFFGILAWGLEGISLYFLIQQFMEVNIPQISLALFIFSFSSIAGFFAIIPGGVGVAEGSITYFLTSLFSLPLSQSIFITLVFRFITLWFGVFLGLINLILYLRSKRTLN